MPENEETPAEAGVSSFEVAGARYERLPATAFRISDTRPLGPFVALAGVSRRSVGHDVLVPAEHVRRVVRVLQGDESLIGPRSV